MKNYNIIVVNILINICKFWQLYNKNISGNVKEFELHEPHIYRFGNIKESSTFDKYKIKFEKYSGIFYFLLFKYKNEKLIKSRILQLSLFDKYDKEIELINPMTKDRALIDSIDIQFCHIILKDSLHNILYYKLCDAEQYYYYSLNHKIKEIFFHPSIRGLYAILYENKFLTFIEQSIQYPLIMEGVYKFYWINDNNGSYFIFQNNINEKNIYLCHIYNNSLCILFLQNCLGLDKVKTIYYSTCVKETINVLYTFNEKDFYPLIYHEGNITNYLHKTKLFHETDYKIYGTIIINDNNVALFSFYKTKPYLKILKDYVGDIEYQSILCYDVTFIQDFYGLIIVNSKINSIKQTYISFNDGKSWKLIKIINLYGENTCKSYCNLQLYMNCDKGVKIKIGYNSPNILISLGRLIIDDYLDDKYYYFISTDFGKNWYILHGKLNNFGILNSGSIIIGTQLSTNNLFYSTDYGLSWNEIKNFNKSLIVQYISDDVFSYDSNSLIMTRNISTMNIQFIDISFVKTIYIMCKIEDYDVVTPGSEDNKKCFMGEKNIIYKRKHNITCLNHDLFSSINKGEKCDCTIDDYECDGEYHIIGNKCIKSIISGQNYNCQPGSYVVQNSGLILNKQSSCNKKNHFEKIQKICRFTETDNVVVVKTSKNIQYLNLDTMMDFIKLPINLDIFINNIKLFDFDILNSCIIMLLVKWEVILKCWENDFTNNNYKKKLINGNITNIYYSQTNRILFYSTNSELVMIDMLNWYKKTILKYRKLKKFIILEDPGIIITLEENIGVKKRKKYTHIYELDGKYINVFESDLICAYYKSMSKTIEIISKNKLLKYNILTKNVEIIFHNLRNITGCSVHNDKILYMYKSAINYNDNIYNIIDIKEVKFYHSIFPMDLTCSKFHCSHFCIKSLNKYKCSCPDNMLLENNQCICEKNKECCSSEEFKCDSGHCLKKSERCDGFIDCHDASDEKNCSKECLHDTFKCADSGLCINIILRCNGYNNCDDGSDEKHCKKICEIDSYKCSNNNCVSFSEVCNKNDDCGDNSDELNCECDKDEFKCKITFLCIKKNYVCDGIKNCLDGSDEEKCIRKYVNKSCTLFCDGICLSKDKICNNFTDCLDGSDEKHCPYENVCLNDTLISCSHNYHCYKSDNICDGFNDCFGFQDEKYCSNFNEMSCKSPQSFPCSKNDYCYTMNQYCDGIYHCLDKSDEHSGCENLSKIAKTSIFFDDSFTYILWTEINNTYTKTFDIKLINVKIKKVYKHEFTKEYRIIFTNLKACIQYRAIIHEVGSKYGKYIDFQQPFEHTRRSLSLKFDKTTQILRWKDDSPYCIPRIYYIKCINSNEKSINLFSRNTQIKLYSSFDSCQISICPKNVFNISCTNFYEIKFLKSSDYRKGNIIEISISVTILAISLFAIIITLSYLAMDRFKYWTSKFYGRLLSGFNNSVSISMDKCTTELNIKF